MTLGLIGQKLGMTRLFTASGESVPVTVVEVPPNRVTRIKTLETDGYRSIQVTMGLKRSDRLNKAIAGLYEHAKVEPGCGLWEFRLEPNEMEGLEVGGTIDVSIFTVGQRLDATSRTIGKGFAGVIKRYNFRTQDATHGNSLSHRAPGSIGQNQSPGRVFKGKKMSGQMGNVRRTAQNLKVAAVDTVRHLVLIKGAIPGAKGCNVILKPAVKMSHLGDDGATDGN